jgi:hypothetical protein
MSVNSAYDLAIWHRLTHALGGVARVAELTDRGIHTVYSWQEGTRFPSVAVLDCLIAAVGDLPADDQREGLLSDLSRWRDAALERWRTRRLAARERFRARFGCYPSTSKLTPGTPSEADEQPPSVAVFGPLAPKQSGLPVSAAVRKEGF